MPNVIVQKLKKSIDIIELVSDYIPLKRRGKNYFGLSPFKHENTASFCVNPQEQYFHCFATNKGGDIITFIQEMEKLDFIGAMQFLIDKYHLNININDKSNIKNQHDRVLYYKIYQQVANYYHKNLFDNIGQQAIDYLNNRKISKQSMIDFSIGYSKNMWDDLIKWGEKNNYDKKTLESFGLIIKGEKNYYDRFRNRLMFPIFNSEGRIIAFSARSLQEQEKSAKYINSPETINFKKHQILYGLDKVKKNITDKDYIIICEGQLDVITLHQINIAKAVCCQGTAFSKQHLEKLKVFSKNFIIAFDGDIAGQDASIKSLDIMLEENIIPNICLLPQKEDPNGILNKYGANKLKEIIETSEDMISYLLNYYKKKIPNSHTAQGKLSILNNILEKIAKLQEEILQLSYTQELADKLNIPILQINKQLAKFKNKKIINKENISTINNKYYIEELYLLDLAYHHQQIANFLSQELSVDYISNNSIGLELKEMITINQNKSWLDVKEIIIRKQKTKELSEVINKSFFENNNTDELEKNCINCLKKILLRVIEQQLLYLRKNKGQDYIKEFQLLNNQKKLIKSKKYQSIF